MDGVEPYVLNGVAVISADNIWAVGANYSQGALIEHRDANGWHIVPNVGKSSADYLIGISALAPDDIWAVGNNFGTQKAFTEHWDGKQWQAVPAAEVAGENRLSGVVVVSASNVWAVGYYFKTVGGIGVVHGLIEHWDGHRWQVVPSPEPHPQQEFTYFELWGITAISATDVWAVGGNSDWTLTLHWDG